MGEILQNIAGICSTITVIFSAILLFVKPLREKVLGTRDIKEGQKCLLRAEMLRVYYKNKLKIKSGSMNMKILSYVIKLTKS